MQISSAQLDEATWQRAAPRRTTGPRCRVSFIVPAFEAERTLPASLQCIRAAAPPHSELIVVDDGSFDGTLSVARELADVVLSRPCQGGAARARNDGARVASGEILFFVDSDVTVSSDAVAGALRHLDGEADAVFGSYEALPPPDVRAVATTYKNILHHFTHLQGSGDASTFWSGFGAVRRDAFLAVHGFDPAVSTGADVEDVHLGYRLRAAGYRILLDPDLRVRHHKRYTVRGVISSDVFHRAVPWTRTMLQLRTFNSDLNLRRSSLFAAALSLGIPATALAGVWIGPPAVVASGALAVVWVGLHRKFFVYVAREWSIGGVFASAGLLYLYYLYGVAGTALGTAAFVLRHERNAALNRLDIAGTVHSPRDVSVSLAVIAAGGETPTILPSLPPPAPWWELLVVATAPPQDLPPGASFIEAADGATRNEMRQLALEQARGEMFATLDAGCVPRDGWLERVRALADTSALVAAGPFEHDRRSVRHRAEQVVRYWQWRPERRPSWDAHHPATNACFRTEVALALGGFRDQGALVLRLAAFGARPVRFDPELGVRLAGTTQTLRFLRGVSGVGRLRASATVRYFDIGLLHRVTLVASSPFAGLVALCRIVRDAVREGSADRTFWLALPLVTGGLASHWIGRDIGLLRPGKRGGKVLRTVDDVLVHGGAGARNAG